jgi:hypothetical protein
MIPRAYQDIKGRNCQAWWLIPVILATWEAKIQRVPVPGQTSKKVCKTPISIEKTESWAWPACHSNDSRDPIAKIGGSQSRPTWAKSKTVSQITRAKRAGGGAKSIECLPSQWKALSSNSTTKKKSRSFRVISFAL